MNYVPRRILLLLWLALLFASGGCAVKWIADYDKEVDDRIVAIYEKTSRFFDNLAEKPPAVRTYASFTAIYSDIATNLRVLLLNQRARPGNADAEKQTELLIETWTRMRERHKRYSEVPEHRSNPFPDSLILLDREQFDALFTAAMLAERARK